MQQIRTIPLVFALALVMAIAPSGCSVLAPSGSMTPQQQYEEASLDLEAITSTLTTLREAGKINDDIWNIVLPVIEEAGRLLDAYETALLAGEVDRATLLRQSARRLVLTLAVHLAVEPPSE